MGHRAQRLRIYGSACPSRGQQKTGELLDALIVAYTERPVNMPYVSSTKKNLLSGAKAQALVRAEAGKALTDTARYVRSKAATYPPKPASSTYKRTGTLGKSITFTEPHFRADEASIQVGTNLHYARYVEEGTGVYGPKGTPIKPKQAKILAWKSVGKPLSGKGKLIASGMKRRKGKLKPNAKKDTYMVFATEVQGMKPWRYMQKAFTDPKTEAYYKARLLAMLKAIQANLEAGA